MKRVLKIDKAIYAADDEAETYVFLGRNPNWKSLDSKENEVNKQSINGYMRIFRDGRTKVFRLRKQLDN